MPALRGRDAALALQHLRLHLVLLEEALEVGSVFVGRREGVPLGLHGVRRRALLPGPPPVGRGGVPDRAGRQARARGVSRHHQALIGIAYLDGHRLSRSVIAGAHFVAERAEALNKINVFPVPDGDTGTNVASTLQKIAAEIARKRQRHIREMSKTIADLAVGSARGNSGAILAQFFCGFSEGLPDAPRVTPAAFGAAAVRAAESAYSAIARPVEGTILTVIRDWARHVADRAPEVRHFGVLLPESLKAALT